MSSQNSRMLHISTSNFRLSRLVYCRLVRQSTVWPCDNHHPTPTNSNSGCNCNCHVVLVVPASHRPFPPCGFFFHTGRRRKTKSTLPAPSPSWMRQTARAGAMHFPWVPPSHSLLVRDRCVLYNRTNHMELVQEYVCLMSAIKEKCVRHLFWTGTHR